MGDSKTWRIFRRQSAGGGRSAVRWLLAAIFLYALLTLLLHSLFPPPAAVSMQGVQHSARHLQFLHDDSWLDEQGERQLSQQIFDELFRMIAQADKLILLDMFLFNAWQGPVPERHRALSDELTDALIARRQEIADLPIIVISDPINTVYGGLQSVHFNRLQQAGITVVQTDLTKLQDSNPTWSGFWRVFIQPFGNAPGELLPNPFGEGRVSLRSYLSLLNFKANHRKLLITDSGDDDKLRALVASANPHDGSSAHRNVAMSFSGEAVVDLVAAERELLLMNEAHQQVQLLDEVLHHLGVLLPDSDLQAAVSGSTQTPKASDLPTVQVLGESRIQQAVLQALDRAGAGDAVDLAMFYLSERAIIEALIAAESRGASVRVLLDVNSDAFGRQKNGVPNRPVAAELVASGVEVRWCATSGEQCHAKWLHVSQGSAAHVFLLGSANFTRRNLHDLNMETDVQVRTTSESPLTEEMITFFDRQWNNSGGRTYSLDYDEFANDSLWLKLQYRFMEMTGLSTF
ncbi:phospholipase D-like domain-containing protein [Granulosicoccus sp. 3-233]|uniref:phospholipase D-like domain-containing protein n=1 Tax=Granulosicoccus sp. 3-233 TaxID=3417969 RepID=UPI003D3275AA